MSEERNIKEKEQNNYFNKKYENLIHNMKEEYTLSIENPESYIF